ncbi:MAG: cytochrome C [Pirellulaceae bacterium]|nr:cytochrome C [Pirellulaceae bacterium]
MLNHQSHQAYDAKLVSVVGTLLLVVFTVTGAAQEFVSPVDSDGRVVDFARDIGPILKSRCLECHGPDDAKEDFRVDDVDSLMSYVEPGDLESSTMYVDYLAIDDDESIMPPKSHGGPLTAAELALIRVWIEEGAHWPEDVELTAEVKKPEPVAPQSLVDRVWAFQGFFHPATVHFPVALLLFGAGFVVLGWKWPTVGTQIPLACLLFGAVTAIAATMMGWSFAQEKGYASWTKFDMDDEFFWHRWGGLIVTVTTTVMAIVALIAVKNKSESLTRVWKIGLLVAAAMVGAVGHQGGELTYGHDFYPKAIRILLGANDQQSANEITQDRLTESEKQLNLAASQSPPKQRD